MDARIHPQKGHRSDSLHYVRSQSSHARGCQQKIEGPGVRAGPRSDRGGGAVGSVGQLPADLCLGRSEAMHMRTERATERDNKNAAVPGRRCTERRSLRHPEAVKGEQSWFYTLHPHTHTRTHTHRHTHTLVNTHTHKHTHTHTHTPHGAAPTHTHTHTHSHTHSHTHTHTRTHTHTHTHTKHTPRT